VQGKAGRRDKTLVHNDSQEDDFEEPDITTDATVRFPVLKVKIQCTQEIEIFSGTHN